ncbi:MAG: class I tRNA ligase family protein, partial [Thermotogota bacterium]
MEYKKTLNLPKTKFPMRAGLAKKEPEFLQKWEEMDLYNYLLTNRQDAENFILHDGPPYANGKIHIGTALNKILKDIIIKYKTMCGFKAPYVPGWDTHGLPIEHHVSKELG